MDQASDDEQRQRVLAALATLPEKYRQPLAMQYLGGADQSAIEHAMGISNGSLRGLLHRGLNLLRERLAEE